MNVNTSSSTVTRSIVDAALNRLFVDQDVTAIDEYVASDYTDHALPSAESGHESLRDFVSDLPDGFRFESIRLLAEDDHAVTHGIYHGFGPEPLIGFDIWRIAGGKITGHRDAIVPQAEHSISGRSQTDGQRDVTAPDSTDASKALVCDLIEQVLIPGNYTRLDEYISSEMFLQHNPAIADGLEGFVAATSSWADEGKPLVYSALEQVIAEGEFVFTRCSGTFGEPVFHYDLWRVSAGKITEHWDVTVPSDASVGS